MSNELAISKPEDNRAMKTFILYLRHTPITLIEQAQGIGRSMVYLDITRAKEILGVPENVGRDLFFETAEMLREAWQNYMAADDALKTETDVKLKLGYEIQKSTYFGMINQMMRTRIESAKLLMPKTETEGTRVETDGEGHVTVTVVKKVERRTPETIMAEMREKGELTT